MSLAPVGPQFVKELEGRPEFVVIMFAKALGVQLSASPTKEEAILAMTGRSFTLTEVSIAYGHLDEIFKRAKEVCEQRK